MDELVEVYLINKVDDQRGYCIDIKGYKSKAKVNRGVHAHTCYSYQGEIAVDQGFDRKRIMKNQFFLSRFNVCMEVSSIVSPGSLSLKDCNLGDFQKFILMSDGRVSLISNKKLCLTAAQGESRKGGGGSPVHLIRNLSFQFCSDKLINYQKWGIRSDQ
ncbi:RICIN domain-containing protein [Gammaproteobacteria bacterium]|nr:RICIN domain-containing protein [Gammaproteobacteria bacterium]